jgi:type II secretory pathway component GspD/PulD (secretin)
VKRWTLALIALLALGGLRPAGAATPEADEAGKRPRSLADYNLPGLQTNISLDLIQPMDVVDLIKFLSIKGNLNIVIGKEVSGTTKLMLKDVALSDALEIILAANNLAYEMRGNILKIMSDKEYREQYGQGFYEQRQAKIIELQYAQPSRVAVMLTEIKSTIGKVVFDDATGTLVLIDTPEKIREMEAVIASAEIPTVERVMPTETRSFTLQYAKVEDLQPELATVLTKDVGKMRIDKRTKTVVITDLPHGLEKAEELITIFDQPSLQVFIEAKIVEVTLKDSFKLGVNWSYVGNFTGPRFTMSASSPFGLAGNESQGALSYKTITGHGDLSAVLDALQTMGNTRILSNPHITALDNEEANIEVIKNEPYAELKYESGTSNVVGKTYQFIPVGVKLAVRPRINEEGFIQCAIKPEVSDVIGTYDSKDPTYGVPIVEKSYAETTVTVKDGITIIIAGMIKDKKKEIETGLPLLSKIPLLGLLFKSKVTETENTELIVFLTPKVVTGATPFFRSKDEKETKK